jgi:flagellar L-ring protein precursor FlgH
MLSKRSLLILCALSLTACDRLSDVGKAPEFSPITGNYEHHAMISDRLPETVEEVPIVQRASLWSGDRQSLLGDRRASQRGDIMTVVIEIDDRAEISNSTDRSRSGSESMALPQFLGLPQLVDRQLAGDATLGNGVDASGSSSSSGDGSVRRNERLTLRIAATVVETLPNGVARIQGSQEVRVNFEVRELLVSGFVRPEDISRQNEITYDKIASARISYGGRGQITDMQQPRYGQQIADIILPF